MNKPSDIVNKDISTEEEFIQLVEQLAVGVIKHLPDGSISLANKKALELLGLTKDQLIGKTPFDPSWHVINEQGQDMPGQLHPAAIALSTKTPKRNIIMGVYRPLTKDRVWILTSAVPELDQFENLKQIIVTFSEVSELKRKEISLNENNRMVKGILDSSYDMIIVYNEKGEKLFLSNSVAEILGHSIDTLYTLPPFSSVIEEDTKRTEAAIEELKIKGTIKYFENRLKTVNGEILEFSWSGKWDADLKYIYLIGKNITNQKKYQEELLKSRRLFKFTTEINDLILNAKQPLDLYNGLCEIAVNTGGFEFAFVGLRDDINETIVPYRYAGSELGYLDYFRKHISIKNIPEGNGPSGRTIRDGKLYYCNDIANDPAMIVWRDEAIKRGFKSSLTMPVRVDNYTIAQIAIYANKPNFFTNEELDLMKRVNENINYAMSNFSIAEKHETAQIQLIKLSQAIEQSTSSIMITDVNGVFEYVNPAFCKTTGYNADELKGVKSSILKSGYTAQEEYTTLWQKISNKESWSGEFCNRRKDGGLYWVNAYISPVVNTKGEITNYIGVEEDITQQKETLSSLENKNKKLAQIAWEQSHLVRAPLARILGMVNLFQNDFISNEEKAMYLNYLKVSAEELDAVIKAIAIKTND
ncbi:MAG TPA: PAS domain S-box protein [Sediminibacterium sp.]|nr:PAS domain S-box protein [Sediminibacterium sp.]